MSQIDFSQTITTEMKEAALRTTHANAVKAECAARISAVLDLVTLTNIQSAALTGELSAGQTAAFAEACSWISMMRAQSKALIAEDPGAALTWPEPPSSVRELASAF